MLDVHSSVCQLLLGEPLNLLNVTAGQTPANFAGINAHKNIYPGKFTPSWREGCNVSSVLSETRGKITCVNADSHETTIFLSVLLSLVSRNTLKSNFI